LRSSSKNFCSSDCRCLIASTLSPNPRFCSRSLRLVCPSEAWVGKQMWSYRCVRPGGGPFVRQEVRIVRCA
jgi:hypothetical protein